MNQPDDINSEMHPDTVIRAYIKDSSGLSLASMENGSYLITQNTDGKKISFSVDIVDEVLPRHDSDGRPFLQVNFNDGRKILLTDRLIGFKPAETQGLDLKKLPKVVTTPDLVSVVEAIEETLSNQNHNPEEIEVLHKVFHSVLTGAEAVGFELETEKSWISCIATPKKRTAV